MFDNFNVNLRKNEGFLISIPCIPIPEYGQSNIPKVEPAFKSNPAVEEYLILDDVQVKI